MIDYSFSIYDLEYFLLILVRVTGFIYLAPFFSMSNTPRNVRVVLSVFISAFLYITLTPREAIVYTSVVEYALIVAKEAMVGLILGFSVNICQSILAFAGSIADMEVGLSMVQLMDPSTNLATTFTGGLYNYAFTMILIASGLYRYLLGALVDTFTLIPINSAVLRTDRLLEDMITFMGNYVLIGFRILLPIMATMMILNAILGAMTKVAPQLNMFSVGVQLKVLTGLCILFITILMLPSVSNMLFEEMKRMLTAVTQSMMP